MLMARYRTIPSVLAVLGIGGSREQNDAKSEMPLMREVHIDAQPPLTILKSA